MIINEQTSVNELLMLLQDGLDEAWPILYARYISRFCDFGRRWGLLFEDAEEIAQDSLFQIARSLHTFDPRRGTGDAWVWSIHKRKMIDRLRKGKNAPKVEELLDTYLDSDRCSPERWAEHHEWWQGVIRAWEYLPAWAKDELRPDRGPGRRSAQWHRAVALLRDLLEKEEK